MLQIAWVPLPGHAGWAARWDRSRAGLSSFFSQAWCVVGEVCKLYEEISAQWPQRELKWIFMQCSSVMSWRKNLLSILGTSGTVLNFHLHSELHVNYYTVPTCLLRHQPLTACRQNSSVPSFPPGTVIQELMNTHGVTSLGRILCYPHAGHPFENRE